MTGAGRAAKESTLYCEIAEGINSYAVRVCRGVDVWTVHTFITGNQSCRPPQLACLPPTPTPICLRTYAHTSSVRTSQVGQHRHMPEIEQGLSEASGKDVKVSFTPHLINMARCVRAGGVGRMQGGPEEEGSKRRAGRGRVLGVSQ